MEGEFLIHSFDGSKVLMGNDVACKVVVISSIQIRIHDGIVKTLTDVRHVPELRKNLIFLGTLDSNSCSYRATSGVMGIVKGAFIMMKVLKQNSLYFLQGSTVTGVAATTSFSDIDSDTTKLWHMRLGHMNERDVLFKEFWAEAVNIAAYLINRSPSTVIDCKAPEKVWPDKDTNYENLRIFGCHAYAHVNDGKLELRTKKCIFLGYASGVKRYRLWYLDSKTSRFLISRAVTFDESSILLKKKELINVGKNHGVREKVELEVRALDSLPIILTNEECGSHSTEKNEESQEHYVTEDIEVEEPIKYKEDIKNMKSVQWIVTMSEEMESLYKNQMWELVKPSVGQKIVGCKWDYKKKELEQLDVKTSFLH
ncbi:hypothetical protein RJ639_015446 [Escallonia herrerae]|uniref:Retrovirus-related Pol polyprotein from transposon TNT 1-94 n=1 Tax=Escallonia herrerae TaxID=1293975 RepID=A0AA88VPX7_9ASTE|nr:hypothetical protein RJ639_015446 [Escallonia herrerae]